MLLSAYSTQSPARDFTLEGVTSQLLSMFASGDSSQARYLLDSSELRWGPWQGESTQQNLAVVHLLVLLCENDLHAARFLTKRSALPRNSPGFLVYEDLWKGNVLAAMEKLSTGFTTTPAEQKVASLLVAKLRAKQLDDVQLGYRTMKVENFAKQLGLTTQADVERFCQMSPGGQFRVEGNVVHIQDLTIQQLSTAQDAMAQVEKLTRVILDLQRETTTTIPSSTKQSASG